MAIQVLKLVSYARCSTHDQVNSVDVQQAAIDRLAEKLGAEVAARFVDRGVSGTASPERRVGLLGALAAIRKLGGRNVALAVSRRDRLARDSAIAGWIAHEVRKLGGQIVSADGANDGEPGSKLMEDVLTAVAGFEGALIRARIRETFARLRERGGSVVGQAPYGLAYGPYAPDGRRTLVPVPAEEAVLERATALRAEGLSYAKVADQLNAEGLRTRSGKAWLPAGVRSVLDPVGREARNRRDRGVREGKQSRRKRVDPVAVYHAQTDTAATFKRLAQHFGVAPSTARRAVERGRAKAARMYGE